MTALVTDLLLRRPSRLLSRSVARLRAVMADPFDLLHKLYWSAPWLECKMSLPCKD